MPANKREGSDASRGPAEGLDEKPLKRISPDDDLIQPRGGGESSVERDLMGHSARTEPGRPRQHGGGKKGGK